MTAMNSWNLMAGQAQGRPELTGKPAQNTVVVLGAGVSGLVTAYELGKLGYDVRVIEARERVGGLNCSVRKDTEHQEIAATEKQVCTFDEGIDVNVGAPRHKRREGGRDGHQDWQDQRAGGGLLCRVPAAGGKRTTRSAVVTSI